MTPDPSVLTAMSAAVDKDPENVGLRLHLIALLLDAGQPQSALAHCTTILERQPDHAETLTKAAQAAEASGDPIRAHGYTKLRDALSWNSAKHMIEGAGVAENSDAPPPPERGEPGPAKAYAGYGQENPGRGEESDNDGLWDSETERPTLTLDQVAGLEHVKKRLNISFLAPMRNPDMRKLFGKSLKGGLMLYGPPGCGKTYIARAIAGELSAKFLAVSLSDVLDMYIGNSEKNIHEIFEAARRNRPCVLFFDEIDALGRKRSLQRHSYMSNVVNQLLGEMDSVGADNEGVFILAATNHPWDVDSALRRPGRLDRALLVPPPDAAARLAVLQLNLADRPTADLDLKWIAERTDGYSGADIAHICDSAVEFAMEDSITTGNVRPIRQPDLKQALRDVKASTRPWFETAKNYVMFANDGGAYDDLMEYMKSHKLI